MELQDVKEFVVLANLCNYQEAADALFMSQPTLSRHIQRLERELGNELFIRTTRRMRLSNFGKLFLPCAQELVCVEHSFQEEFRELIRQTQEVIKISAIPTMAAYRFTDILAKFQTNNPRYRVEVEELTTLNGLFKRIENGEVDFAMIHGPDKWEQGIGHFKLFDDHLVIALPQDHPLASIDQIHLSSLRKEKFITPPQTSPVFEYFINECHRQGFDPQIGYSGHREDVLLALVRNGFGVGAMLHLPAEYSQEEGIKLVEVIPAIQSPVSIAFLDTPYMTSRKKAFLECCRETFNQK